MATIVIPAALRRHMLNPVNEACAEGSTVAEALENLLAIHPELRSSIFSEDGSLSEVLRIFIGGESIDRLEGLNTAVGPREEILLLPPIAGG